MKSMTGFGQATVHEGSLRVDVALRSVNHRFLDIVVRVAEAHRDLESTVREAIAAKVGRGRIEAAIEISGRAASSARVEVDVELVRALHAAAHSLEAQGLVRAGLSFAELLRLPDAVRVERGGGATDASELSAVVAALAAGLEQMIEARAREGESLRQILLAKLDGLELVRRDLTIRRSQSLENLASDFEQRLRTWVGEKNLDENRLAQEVAIWVDRSDVTEELDRLGSHLVHFRQAVEENGSLGKRLDFLAQEIARELNTIGSKSRDAEVARLVIEAKLLCEQIREQVQNVE